MQHSVVLFKVDSFCVVFIGWSYKPVEFAKEVERN